MQLVKKILNIGSINIDHVYELDHFVNPGETLSALSYHIFPGGKGFNQSVALAKAGATVWHAGKIGEDGRWLKEYLLDIGVNTSFVRKSSQATGHAIIQVVPSGENAIVIHGGANKDMDAEFTDEILLSSKAGDFLLLQNEINDVNLIIKKASEKDLVVVLNPAPMTADVREYSLDTVDWFIVNEIEGAGITGKKHPDDILQEMLTQFPQARIVLTLGKKGALYADSANRIQVPAKNVEAVDTTGTGDTFIGYLLNAVIKGKEIKEGLEEACTAAAICATREGAASSIPSLEEVKAFGKK